MTRILIIVALGGAAVWLLWKFLGKGKTAHRNPDGTVNYTSEVGSKCVWDPAKGSTVCQGGDITQGIGWGLGGAIGQVAANPAAFTAAGVQNAPPPPPPDQPNVNPWAQPMIATSPTTLTGAGSF
jgi:hypothetical protein